MIFINILCTGQSFLITLVCFNIINIITLICFNKHIDKACK